MSQQIDAIFDHGVFKPLAPPALPDQAQVRLTVETRGTSGNAPPINADFDAELEPLLFDGPSLPTDFSRADIYVDHD